MKLKKKPFLLFSLGIIGVCVVALLARHEVNISLTEEDRLFIPKYLAGVGPLPEPKSRSYEDELHFIISVQRSVLEIAPTREPLPFARGREPKDLYEAREGLCYYKSRVIEKILIYSGFVVRHFAM